MLDEPSGPLSHTLFIPPLLCPQVDNDLVWNVLADWGKIDTTCVIQNTRDADRLIVRQSTSVTSVHYIHKFYPHIETFMSVCLAPFPMALSPLSRMGPWRLKPLGALISAVAGHCACVYVRACSACTDA